MMLQGIFFAVCLISITIGCAMERASLGFIVPGAIVLSMIVYAHFVPAKGIK